jgi:hypothetical protein
MKYQTFHETTLEGGENHKKHNKPCQDRSWDDSKEGMHIAVVADGHGSDNCFRSEYGAEFAVKAAKSGIETFIKSLKGNELPLEDNFARQVKKLVGTIVDNWIYLVSEHYKCYPITEEDKEYSIEGKTVCFKGLKNFEVDKTYRDLYLQEAAGGSSGKGGLLADDERPVTRHAYGATLIAAAVTEDFWFGIQIGDGKLTCFYPDGSFDQPVPWDDKCYLNVTTSICDDDAAERARVFVKKRNGSAAAIDAIGAIKKLEDRRPLPSAVFLNSDGVDDSFPIEDNMDHMAKKFYYSVLRMFIEEDDNDPAKGWASAAKELADYLPDLSKRGSGDDISVAGIIDMDAVKAAPFRSMLQKAKVEAEERRAREKEEREKAIKAAEEARIKAAEEKKAAEEEAAKKSEERKAAEEEAAKKAEKKKAEDMKATQVKKAPESVGKANKTNDYSANDGSANSGAQRINPDSFKQSADDPLVQEKAKQLLKLQEAEKEAARILKEIKQESEKKVNELAQAVQSSLQKKTSEDDTDIPSSDAYKTQMSNPQLGTKVNVQT